MIQLIKDLKNLSKEQAVQYVVNHFKTANYGEPIELKILSVKREIYKGTLIVNVEFKTQFSTHGPETFTVWIETIDNESFLYGEY